MSEQINEAQVTDQDLGSSPGKAELAEPSEQQAQVKRGGKVWINVYPDRPITKKPAETRMGSGKGSPEWWIANVKPGRVLFELSGVSEDVAREAMRLAIHKLPFKARFIKREVGDI